MNFHDWRGHHNVALEDRVADRFLVGDGCWEWTGRMQQSGYGVIDIQSIPRKAHRVVYEMMVGSIPVGLDLDHLCRNRRCVRPAHLEPVTRAENTRRGTAGRAAQERMRSITHCPKGHPYDDKNTRIAVQRGGYPNRVCRACHRERMKARRG